MFKKKDKKKDNTKIRTSSFKLKSIPVRENGDNYYYIENFEQATDKQCKEYDKLNQLIFQKYNSIYDKISNKIGDCPFKLDKKPEHPKSPNNYESLLKWKAMNSVRNVSQQTMSTLYLLKHNFKISLDFDKEGIKPSEIIDVALKEANNDLELIKREGYEYLNLYKQNKEQIDNNCTDNKKNNKNIYKSKNIGSILGSSYTDDLSSSSSSIEINFGFDNKDNCVKPENNQCHNKNNNNIVEKVSHINLHMINPNQHNNNNNNNNNSLQPRRYHMNNVNMKGDIQEHYTIKKNVGNFDNLYPTTNTSNYNNSQQCNKIYSSNSSINSNSIYHIPSAPPDYNN
tara:strand:+ start:63 stop:1085 length:1023 start_codon:yes stop_codon:yes gene_type:complete